MEEQQSSSRTAGEAGWHASRYNISAPIPDTDKVVIVNLLYGTCEEFNPLELYLLSVVEELSEDHPILNLLSRRGVISNVDELAVLESMGRIACADPKEVGLVVCPTMACNFDCPYCFENHFSRTMSPEVQDDVVALAERMLRASGTKALSVNWFGGEPLLAYRIIESLSYRFMELADRFNASYRAGIITNGYLLTQEIADMLVRVKVDTALITLDGIGATHDATRHLVGGGPTFERIVSNLRTLRLPFHVDVRHNIYEGNHDDEAALEELVSQIAEESGNSLSYKPAVVSRNEAYDQRDAHMPLLCGSSETEVRLRQEVEHFTRGRAYFCGASKLWGVGIDPLGNLQKCWEAVDKPQYSFGTAHDWDPANPFATAKHPDLLTCYLNSACPVPDEECRACVWLPLCVGDCPHKRLFDGGRTCFLWRDDPTDYILALHKHRSQQRAKA